MTFPFMNTGTRHGRSSIGISPPSSEKMALHLRHTAGKRSSTGKSMVAGGWFTFTIPECRPPESAKVSERREHFFEGNSFPGEEADGPPRTRHFILIIRAEA